LSGPILILLVLAGFTFALAFWLRRRTGLPWARIVSEDVGPTRHLETPLYSARLGLSGKPDYLIEQRGRTIPVEVKPGRTATNPYDSDLMQLAAYCLLIEETENQPPPYGLLRYANTTFRLNYTPTLREELLAILDEMNDLLDVADVERSHDDPRRCRGCGFREICGDELG
jgi:CRISPR-associated exonuclease Cas4